MARATMAIILLLSGIAYGCKAVSSIETSHVEYSSRTQSRLASELR